jgi:hypothetical protein
MEGAEKMAKPLPPRLTPDDLALLHLVWPDGARHSGPCADVFAVSSEDGSPGIVISRRRNGSYAIADTGGRMSTERRCLTSMLSAELQRYAEIRRAPRQIDLA